MGRQHAVNDSDFLRVAPRGAFVLLSLLVAFLLALNSIGPVRSSVPPSINPEPASLVLGQTSFNTNASKSGPSGLSEPEFLAFDGSGDLWVSDYNNSLVAEYTPPFMTGESASLELGSLSFSTTGCSGTGAGDVCNPNGIAFDPSGNLWVADSGNNSIVEFKAPFTTGERSAIAIGEYSDGQPNATNLDEPQGIAFDSAGNLWVADSSDNRVVEYKAPLASGEAASLVIGQASLTSATDDDGRANLSSPEDVAFDHSGNLWVADTQDSRVLEFAFPFSNGEEASAVIGAPNFSSVSGNDTQSTLTLPEAIAFDHSGDLWVSDSGNSRVLEFPQPLATGENATDLIGQYSYFYGGPNATQYQLGYPEGIAFDSTGNLWVADPGYARVLEYSDPLTYKPTSTTSTSTSITSTTTLLATTSLSTSSQSPVSTSSSSSSSLPTSTASSTGTVPAFPYELIGVAALVVVVSVSYMITRRRVLTGRA